MTPGRQGREGRWRLLLGTAAFVVWAPPSLLGLPLAGLLLATRPRTTAEWGTAGGVGLLSAGLLLLPATDLLTGFVRAYTVLVAAAFVVVTLFAVGEATLLGRAIRAGLIGGVAAVVLARVQLGGSAWDALHWEPVVRFVSDRVPATLALQTLAGLTLAWQWHRRVARHPLGPPPAPFRDFRFGDHWVWAIIVALVGWITPVVAGLKLAALNLLVVLGGLYLVRGIAIVVACAAAFGIAPAALVIGAVVAAALALPLLLLLPGLATLGITDTWLEFRRRLKARA
ncbi:MAG: hypothetical protein AUH34_00930 [Gemmatimonadetes bacterium 13_1_40CM_70_12]|nr:MAG: hypothetical protein AUH34_00930 [Gemmatimonadetes bacterium 13_1_40CM_70_12]